ncbi:DUF3267 domain-containing protein [Caldalkalibacillus mannanilyticus]|uniref:DUF3267 domain-containing protein n=1 Tax=Caldalkalibacillus mannanilyticus TaxID=1418 RepID=UPI00046A928B|nr:DUF3267 domain-containing protein [Caldalkalibacillus mannanilyticus]
MVNEKNQSIDATFKIEDYEQYIGIILGLGIVVLTFLYFHIWDLSSFKALISLRYIFILIGLVIVGLILHELIHAFFFLILSKGNASGIKFGCNLKQGIFYVGCSEPLKINSYRVVVFAPSFFLGMLPLIISYLYNLPLLFIWSIIMLLVSIGDFLILWNIKKFPASSYVQDHHEKIGCLVFLNK